MRIEAGIKLDFDDVLLRPKRSTLRSREKVVLLRDYTFANSKSRWIGVPIIAANMDTVGTFEMSAVLKNFEMVTALHKHYTLDNWNENSHLVNSNSTAVSIGISDVELDRLHQIIEIAPGLRFIVIDVANGYGQYLVEFVEKVRDKYPDRVIIAGNVVTGDMTEQLIVSGADIVKVGIGPGSACTTRIQTGVGYPQLSAIIECADAAHGMKGHIIADGGCRTPGDIAKAFGAGADFVMLGGMLAGHDESAGEIESEWVRGEVAAVDPSTKEHLGYIDIEKKYKRYHGMSSETAQNKYYAGKKYYRASEGRNLRVPYKGPVSNTVQEILGGLRSACTYVGAESLKELSKRTTFVKVNHQYNDVYERYEL